MGQRETTWALPIGLLTAIVVPFLVTGAYRLAPDGLPTPLPFVVVFLLAIAALVVGGTFRAVGFGLLVGSVVYGIFLASLLTTW